ncbi:hypothetical protein PYW08_013520 [Mythimna loreyi]|uniref:Uncharacterized protein n=1 Tax=Mythimna loreyi TaxID=667449 RepID=A0ACC2QHS1_9NEOP|nr:hypothetical protein PYW08_013520 [Mythimna loreyi]
MSTRSRSSTSTKFAAYSTKSLKPCVSAPTCTAHRHRPRPPPCPEPDECYRRCKNKKRKCQSAVETVTREGSRCSFGYVLQIGIDVANRIAPTWRKRDAILRWKSLRGERAAAPRRWVTRSTRCLDRLMSIHLSGT